MSAPKPALSLTDSQRAQLTFRPVDRNNKPANLAEDPVWSTSDATVVLVRLGKIKTDGKMEWPNDNSGIYAVAEGVCAGTARISVKAYVRVPDSKDKAVLAICGVLDVTVSHGNAFLVPLDANSPVEIP